MLAALLSLPAFAQDMPEFEAEVARIVDARVYRDAPLVLGIVGDDLWKRVCDAAPPAGVEVRLRRVDGARDMHRLLLAAGAPCGWLLSTDEGALVSERVCFDETVVLSKRAQNRAQAAALAAPAGSQQASYASISTFLYLPTALTFSLEERWGNFAVSGSVFGGYAPDLFFVGGFGLVGGGLAAHGIYGDGVHHFEMSAGLDLGATFSSSGAGFVPFPSIFLGYRTVPRTTDRPMARVGVELSSHSLLGLTLSVGPHPARR